MSAHTQETATDETLIGKSELTDAAFEMPPEFDAAAPLHEANCAAECAALETSIAAYATLASSAMPSSISINSPIDMPNSIIAEPSSPAPISIRIFR